MQPHRLLRWLLFVAGLVCLAAALFPSGSRVNTPEEQRTAFRLGIPASPLLTYDDVQSQSPEPNGGFRSSSHYDWRVQFISWSAGLLVLGIVLLVFARRVGRSGGPGT